MTGIILGEWTFWILDYSLVFVTVIRMCKTIVWFLVYICKWRVDTVALKKVTYLWSWQNVPPIPTVFHSLKGPKVRVWVLLSPCNRGRLLVGAMLVSTKQKVFLPGVWSFTMKTQESRIQPWFTAVIFPKYWAFFHCKSPILRLITLTINSKWSSGPLYLLLGKGRKKENSWNLK